MAFARRQQAAGPSRISDSIIAGGSGLPVQSSDRWPAPGGNARLRPSGCPATPARRPGWYGPEHHRGRRRWQSEIGQSPRRLCLVGPVRRPEILDFSIAAAGLFAPLVIPGGLGGFSLLAEQLSYLVVGISDVRVDFNRSAKMQDRFVRFIALGKQGGEVRVREAQVGSAVRAARRLAIASSVFPS